MGIAGVFLDANPVTSEKISRAVYRAAKWLDANDENKAECARILLEHSYISGTVEYAVQLYKMFRYGISSEVTVQTLYHYVDQFQALGIIDKNLSADDIKAQIWVPFNLEGI
jgi:NitT/TauT family transport system substrate-binding protein